jgi:hypothetical protein
VAIVDAFDDPNAESDLGFYRSSYGLPACTTANGCFSKVNQSGAASPLPPAAGSSGWASEISLDLDMVSAICPNCHILLVEANSTQITDLGTGVDAAVNMGAKYVSNSYGGAEFSGESGYDGYYNHPGVAVTVAAGDSGYGVEWPAAAQYVTAVGGTSLIKASNARGWAETVWGNGINAPNGIGTGSGCSTGESKPSWQTDSGCSDRTVNDVAADADPNTGAYVYDTYDQGGWAIFGGTSEASPIIASVYALAGGIGASDYPSSYLYARHNAGNMNDVTSGSNGSCGTYLCNGGSGYDGPTGLGTPEGLYAFGQIADTISITNPGSQSTNLNASVSLQIHASANSGLPLSYSATGLPTGLSINGSTGLISGTATAAGSYTVTVTASDATPVSNSVTFGWTVRSGPVATYTGTIRLFKMGYCLDDRNNSSANGAIVQIWRCNGLANQVWQVMSDGTIQHNGLCADARNFGTTNGTKVQLWACTGKSNQQWNTKNWRVNYTNPAATNKVLDDTGFGGNGTQQEIWTNNGTINQAWATS